MSNYVKHARHRMAMANNFHASTKTCSHFTEFCRNHGRQKSVLASGNHLVYHMTLPDPEPSQPLAIIHVEEGILNMACRTLRCSCWLETCEQWKLAKSFDQKAMRLMQSSNSASRSQQSCHRCMLACRLTDFVIVCAQENRPAGGNVIQYNAMHDWLIP